MKAENVVLDIQYDKILAVPSDSRFRTFHYSEMREHRFSKPDAETRGQEIANFLTETFPSLTSVVFNAPSESIMIRNVSVPVESNKKSYAVLNYELDAMLPVPLEETVYSYHVYQSDAFVTQAIAYVCKKEVLYPFMFLFQKLDITVKGIYVIPHILFSLVPFAQEKSGYLLHLSSTVSYLLAFHEGKLLDARVIPMGMDILTAILAGQWKKTFEESEAILRRLPAFHSEDHDTAFYKKHFDINKAQAKLIQKTAIDFSASLVEEIKKSKLIELQQETSSDEKKSAIKELPVFVSSDTSSSVFVENLLASRMGVSIKKLPVEKTPVALLKKTSLIFLSVAMSFAPQKGVDLLSGDLKKMVHLKKNKWIRWALITAISGILLFVFSFGYDFYLDYRKMKQADKELHNIFSNQFGLPPTEGIPLVTQAQQLVEKERKRTELMRLFFDRDGLMGYLSVLQEVLSSSPSVEVDQIYYDMKSLRVNGTCANFNDMQAIKEMLEQKNVFSSIDSNERLMPSKNTSLVKFDLKLGLVKNETDK